MPTSSDIIQAIAEHLVLPPEDVDAKARLREELNLGPIELNDLLDHLKKRFNVDFDPQDVENLTKVEDLVVLVEDNLIA